MPPLLCLLATIIMTYPLIWNLGQEIERGDGILNAWIIMWNVHAIQTDPLNIFNANIFYPTKSTLLLSENLLGTLPFALPIFSLTGNPIATYHLIIFIGFFLSCYGAYLLSHYLCGNHSISFVAGVLYSFCTYKVTHFWWFQLTQSQWIPISILFLHKFLDKKKLKDILLFSVFFCWQATSSMYYGLFLLLVTPILFITYSLINKGEIYSKVNLAKLGVSFGLVVFLLGPIIIQFFTINGDYNLNRSSQEISEGSANILSFWSSPNYNYFWGEMNHNLLPSGVPWEKYNFIGLSFFLSIVGAGYLWIKKKLHPNKTNSVFYFALLVFTVLVSCGPELYFGRWHIGSNPVYHLANLIPGFEFIRVPARLAVVTMLALAVFSALILSTFAAQSKLLKIAVPFIFALIVVTDHFYLPIDIITKQGFKPPKDIPKVYQWLGQQPGDFSIIEIPLKKSLWKETEYMYYSIFHWKKMVNGYSGFEPPSYSEAVKLFNHFPNVPALKWARDHNIKYLIVHTNELKNFNQNRLKKILSEGKLKLFKIFGSDLVFTL